MIIEVIISLFMLGFFVVMFVVFFGIKVVKEYDRGVRFTLGRYSGIMNPGLNFIVPILQSWKRVDIRTKAVDVPDQDCITKDNVSVNVNAVIYYKVESAEKAILEVIDYRYAMSQLAQITMRNVVGEVTLDELLSQRDAISERIRLIVDKASDPWGIKVESVELKDIELPEEMKRVMAKQAEAEREKRATIIRAYGEVTAAVNIAKASAELEKVPGALHLRTLHTINDLSSDKSNTVVYALPTEILRMVQRIKH